MLRTGFSRREKEPLDAHAQQVPNTIGAGDGSRVIDHPAQESQAVPAVYESRVI